MAVRKLAPENMQPESFVLSQETEAFADKEIAKKAYLDCKLVRESVRRALKVPNGRRGRSRKRSKPRR